MRYIIFGGSGSFGTAMTKRLLETTDAKIRISFEYLIWIQYKFSKKKFQLS